MVAEIEWRQPAQMQSCDSQTLEGVMSCFFDVPPRDQSGKICRLWMQ